MDEGETTTGVDDRGGSLESPKMVAGALIGGTVATSAGTLMNSIIGH